MSSVKRQTSINSYFSSSSNPTSELNESEKPESDCESNTDSSDTASNDGTAYDDASDIDDESQASGVSCSCCSTDQPPVTKKSKSRAGRTFQHGWFQDHKWLSYCTARNKAFCHSCRLAVEKGLVSMPKKKGHRAFVVDGFCNWKKAKMSFKKHERGQLHKEACLKLNALHQPSVATQLSNELQKDQLYRRKMFFKVLTSLKLLTRQGLPIRGHTDEESNLIQLQSGRCGRSSNMDKFRKVPFS